MRCGWVVAEFGLGAMWSGYGYWGYYKIGLTLAGTAMPLKMSWQAVSRRARLGWALCQEVGCEPGMLLN